MNNPQIHEALGFDEAAVNGFVIGGSAVSPETVRFLLSLDLKLLEVTSMTEMGGLPQLWNTINPGEFRIGKVGLEFPELCDVKLSNKDEVSCHPRKCCVRDYVKHPNEPKEESKSIKLNLFFTDRSW